MGLEWGMYILMKSAPQKDLARSKLKRRMNIRKGKVLGKQPTGKLLPTRVIESFLDPGMAFIQFCLAIAIWPPQPSNFPPPFSMDLQLNLTAPILLYMPTMSRVLQVIQLPNAQHPFIGFSEMEHYLVMGYMAHQYCGISPIYCPDYVVATRLDALLPIVSMLTIHHLGDTLFHTVYEKQVIETQFCQPNAAGIASPMWLASELHDPIRFNPAIFPFGYPPPTVTNMAPLLTQSVMDCQFTSTPPSVGLSWSANYDHAIDQEDYLTTASLGYAEDSLIPPPEPEVCEYFGVLTPTIQTVFNEALVRRVISQGKVAQLPTRSSFGWDTIHLTFSGTIESRLLEMRKIIQGCIHLKAGFSGNSDDEWDKKVNLFFDLFNSSNQEDVGDRALVI
ncbi:hypothetical protein DFH29DRAFT_1009434 [Suillus ampliporus]|nr:hypothetical protein DFH29DRAFT_1009434 [Suillus ampliporus]